MDSRNTLGNLYGLYSQLMAAPLQSYAYETGTGKLPPGSDPMQYANKWLEYVVRSPASKTFGNLTGTAESPLEQAKRKSFTVSGDIGGAFGNYGNSEWDMFGDVPQSGVR